MRLLGQFQTFYFFYDKILHAPKSTKRTQGIKKYQKTVLNFLFIFFMLRFSTHKRTKRTQGKKSTKKHQKHKSTTKQKQKTQISEQKLKMRLKTFKGKKVSTIEMLILLNQKKYFLPYTNRNQFIKTQLKNKITLITVVPLNQ